jgi:hypothetical protein
MFKIEIMFKIICWCQSVRISGGNCKYKQGYFSLLSFRGGTALD